MPSPITIVGLIIGWIAKAETVRSNYDFSHGVRGKYYQRFQHSRHLIRLEPDVRRIFPDAAAVNKVLRDRLKLKGKSSS